MLNKLKLGPRLVCLFLVAGLAPLTVAGYLNFKETESVIDKETQSKLTAIRQIKKSQIEGWFAERQGDIEVLSSFYEVADAVNRYQTAFDGGIHSQEYKDVDQHFDPVLKKYKETYGYYDLFLIGKAGDVVYTVEHEPDFGTNLVSGGYKTSGLANAFRDAMAGKISIQDFRPYAPSADAPASFIAAPIVSNNQTIGVIALQMPLDAINKIMQERSGMGESGETYLVGDDYLMRSDSRFSDESTVLGTKIQTDAARAALNGKSGCMVTPDYRKIPVYSCYSQIEVAGLNWAILSEIDEAEARLPITAMRNTMAKLLLGFGFAVFAMAMLVARNIRRTVTGPLVTLTQIAQDLSVGDVTQDIHVSGNDEIGNLSAAFQKMVLTQRAQANVANELARGNVQVNVPVLSERDVLGTAMKTMADAQGQQARVAREIADGNLDVSVEVLSDEDMLGQAMATMKESLAEVVREANQLADAALAGDLDTRADASQHRGEFARVLDGFNRTLDATIAPMKEASEVLEDLANYDLRARMRGTYAGDHERIKTALNNTASALHEVLSQVVEASNQVKTASAEIASGAQNVAQGASEQAGALEETSSSLEEMSGMSRQNRDNTMHATELATSTRTSAESGNLAMTNMLTAMERIQHSAESTAKIIEDINEIAFQTNLLALNAAVEAARAGDAGRGFAVVADEVRSLALRSKDAAKRTEALIRESLENVKEGGGLASDVRENLDKILESAGKVGVIVNEIAQASREQTSGIDQINRAVSEMDKVVQQSAANAEESASASEELSGQAELLASMVSRFQMD